MVTEPHTLRINTRKNQLTVDGICSCAKWRVINRLRADVREQHGQHLDEMLGPDAQRRRLGES